jgi:4-methyl-5(b-hydroxyethyl)-thiazole monophosphate biosynthesis
MSRGIKVQADCLIDECAGKEWDCVALPGGMPGAEHLRDSKVLMDIVKQQKDANKLYGAICAAPAVALAAHGLIDGPATCYPAPAFRSALKTAVDDEDVVVTGNLVTSQGPGTALLFALQLGQELYGKEARDKIAKQLLVS